MFTGPIEYSTSAGFGTTKFSLPFKLLQLDQREKLNLVERNFNSEKYAWVVDRIQEQR